MADGTGTGLRVVRSTYTCTQCPTAATVSVSSGELGGGKTARRYVTLLVPSRVTAKPTTSGSGNWSSAK